MPLKESRVISDADLVALYSNIEEIWDLHTTMLGRLYTLASDKKPDQSLSHSVGDLFMQKVITLQHCLLSCAPATTPSEPHHVAHCPIICANREFR